MWKHFNKNISTPTGIIIILILGFLLGAYTHWQFSIIQGTTTELPILIIPDREEDELTGWQTYTNEEYGFEIFFPDSWRNYSVLMKTWKGVTLDGESIEFQGPKIIIRNPRWTIEQSWQDIPIMVFTKNEWSLIKENNLNVSAAPIDPSKLGENQEYVFALPPRWIGFTDALGQDEARKIIETFRAF